MTRKPPAPSLTPGVAAAVAYCHDVLSGRIAACRLVHLTCERFLRDLAEAQAGHGPWEFRPELAERAMIFAGLLPNIRGPEAGRPLRLMAWQRVAFANLSASSSAALERGDFGKELFSCSGVAARLRSPPRWRSTSVAWMAKGALKATSRR